MRKLIGSLILLAFLIPVQNVFAWGQKGHRIIGEIAYHHLTKKAKKNIDKILGINGLVYWGNWADEIRSDTIYANAYDWHFQDLDEGMTDSAVVATLTYYPEKGGRLWFAVDSLSSVLRHEPNSFDALRFFVHLIGDCFCPMHTAHFDDLGGNKVKIKWFGESANLHRIWDSDLINARGYSYTEYAEYLEHQFSNQQTTIEKMSRAELVLKNYNLCNDIYAYQAAGDTNTYHYIYRFANEMEWRLYAAGIRLAKLLNEIYG